MKKSNRKSVEYNESIFVVRTGVNPETNQDDCAKITEVKVRDTGNGYYSVCPAQRFIFGTGTMIPHVFSHRTRKSALEEYISKQQKLVDVIKHNLKRSESRIENAKKQLAHIKKHGEEKNTSNLPAPVPLPGMS